MECKGVCKYFFVFLIVFAFYLCNTHPRLGPRLGEGTSFYVASPENKGEVVLRQCCFSFSCNVALFREEEKT